MNAFRLSHCQTRTHRSASLALNTVLNVIIYTQCIQCACADCVYTHTLYASCAYRPTFQNFQRAA